jgi:hypothetical protein
MDVLIDIGSVSKKLEVSMCLVQRGSDNLLRKRRTVAHWQ